MNSFYISLLIVVLTSAVAGYITGFIRLAFALLKISAGITAAYFCYSMPAMLLMDNFMVTQVWANIIAFLVTFVVVFIALHFLLKPLSEKIITPHKRILNKASGAVVSVVFAGMIFLLTLPFSSLVSIPQEVEDEIKAQGFSDVVRQPFNFVNDKVLPMFREQPVQVMALKATAPVSEEGIFLAYTTTDYTTQPGLEAQMLQMVNTERRLAGLKTLSADSLLTIAARAHSADMLKRGYFSHNTPDGINPFQRLHKLNIDYLYAGENLAMAPTLMKAHNGLMRSPGHKANILNPSYGKVGIGILNAGIHGLMITQEFKD